MTRSLTHFFAAFLMSSLFSSLSLGHTLITLQRNGETETLSVTGQDSELLRAVFGHYENMSTALEIVGLKSVQCLMDTCQVVTSQGDVFEADELVENEQFDLSPFKNLAINENALMAPTLEHLDKTDEMTFSSKIPFRLMATAPEKSVIPYHVKLPNGLVESKTLRGEKIEIRCFHAITEVRPAITTKNKKTGGKFQTEENYNCQIYAKIKR